VTKITSYNDKHIHTCKIVRLPSVFVINQFIYDYTK